VLRITGNVFIVLGATLLFFVLYELVGTSMITDRHQSALAEQFDLTFERPPLAQPTTDPVVASPSPTAKPRAHSAGPEPIARIIIPSIGVRNIVVEGVTLNDLAWGPGHYKGTSDIGQAGVTAIAGHRTGWGSPFINLDKLERGDEIIFETPEATYTYEMTRRTVVDAGDVKVLLGDPKSNSTHKLTLTTCTPKYTSLRRLIVWGDLVDVKPRK